jgi:hypothetical protein
MRSVYAARSEVMPKAKAAAEKATRGSQEAARHARRLRRHAGHGPLRGLLDSRLRQRPRAVLSTLNFQAPGFYERNGWRVFGDGGAGAGIGAVRIFLGSTQVVVAGVLPPLVIIGSWIVFGASPGKMMCRIRIIDEPTGGRPTPWQCIGRYFMALIGVLWSASAIWIVIDPRRQGWHDKLVRTLVVHDRRP